ncbi:hypothetical protein [Anaerolentibacter hominis]|uniref:hypothetical protein n=1 Tax=Anaerolentibacter hominis TaxID=3079009 RepID=UPI0031B7FAE7
MAIVGLTGCLICFAGFNVLLFLKRESLRQQKKIKPQMLYAGLIFLNGILAFAVGILFLPKIQGSTFLFILVTFVLFILAGWQIINLKTDTDIFSKIRSLFIHIVYFVLIVVRPENKAAEMLFKIAIAISFLFEMGYYFITKDD